MGIAVSDNMAEHVKPEKLASNKGRYVFIPPRYGENIAGGAETLVRELAEELAKRGNYIEIWTTCASDNRTWVNELPAGETTENGLRVLRFPVDQRDLERWVPLQIRISEGMNLTLAEQIEWLQAGVNSKALYQHILNNFDDFDCLFFAPYLFGTTFWGSLIAPSKSVLIPCLHNESYAYLDCMYSMFAKVRGCLFNTAAEMDLARGIYGNILGAEVGKGFYLPEQQYVSSLTPYFNQDFPYLLYLGRKETGKNVQLLIDYFLAGKSTGALPEQLKLVICGGGSFSDVLRPKALETGEIIDLAHVNEGEKLRLLKYALALCQPSLNESFSIVLMEAWSVCTPVLVHSYSTVTRQQVTNSGAGLFFADNPEFLAVVNWLINHNDQRQVLGQAGYNYVQDYYSWNSVIKRFDYAMQLIFFDKLKQDSVN